MDRRFVRTMSSAAALLLGAGLLDIATAAAAPSPREIMEKVTVTRKLHVDAGIARRKVELLAEFDVASPDVADVLAAIDLHRLHGINFWDALIVRSAKQSGCSVLFSEDMQAVREIDGVRIVNPFPFDSGACGLYDGTVTVPFCAARSR